ncbi:MAG: hypothetical protein ACJAUP_002469 [Cellvibrionaceae bacterium]|jgi:hypothetical protein
MKGNILFVFFYLLIIFHSQILSAEIYRYKDESRAV